MIDSYSDFTAAGAVRIVKACLSANKAHMIVSALLDRRSAESVEAELAAETARPPERTAGGRDREKIQSPKQTRQLIISAALAARPVRGAMSKVLRDAKPSQPA